MSWKVMFGEIKTEIEKDGEEIVRVSRSSDQEVGLDQLSPQVFDDIAKDIDAGLTYMGVYRWPAEHPGSAYGVIEAAAKHLGIEPPAKPTTMAEQTVLILMLEETEDIADQPHMDGLPKVPSETGTGSSTTSPDPLTGGSPPSPEESP